MSERHQPVGGVRSQLRSLAEQGSFDEDWNQPHAQHVKVGRTLSVPNEEAAKLEVTFRATKFNPDNRPSRLLTRYSLSTAMIYDDLPPEVVPPYVQFALKERNLQAWKEAVSTNRAMIISTASDSEMETDTVQELIYQDAINIDDALFRFEREVNYTLDGRGRLLSEQRSDRFYDIDSDKAIFNIAGTVDLIAKDGSMASWVEKATEPRPLDMELMRHPDLRKLEYKMDKVELRNFLRFAELVSDVEQDKELVQQSRLSRQQELLSILAFLRYEAPVRSILNLVQ